MHTSTSISSSSGATIVTYALTSLLGVFVTDLKLILKSATSDGVTIAAVGSVSAFGVQRTTRRAGVRNRDNFVAELNIVSRCLGLLFDLFGVTDCSARDRGVLRSTVTTRCAPLCIRPPDGVILFDIFNCFGWVDEHADGVTALLARCRWVEFEIFEIVGETCCARWSMLDICFRKQRTQ